MNVDIDAIVQKLTGWDLKLTVNGKQYVVQPPSNAAMALAHRVGAGTVIVKDCLTDLRNAVAAMIPEAQQDVDNWMPQSLVGVLHAIAVHSKDTIGKNYSGVGAAVQQAMTPTPAAPAPAPVPVPAQPPAASDIPLSPHS